MKYHFFSLLIVLFISGCGILVQPKIIYQNCETLSPSRNLNVCKTLKDTVVVYAIFVDVDSYHPWTQYDIDSTLDSLKKSMLWIESKARENNQQLKINSIIHSQQSKLSVNETKIKPYDLKLDLNLLNATNGKHINDADKWADKIAIYASKGVKTKSESKVKTKNKVSNVERLIARLRNQYKTDNVALLFFVNGYYENQPSMSFHTYSSGPAVEYSIITNKNPGVIAHEFLHLFGAVDLYPNQRHSFNYSDLKEAYPNEIMRVQHKSINKLMLSPITKYYIGWANNLDKDNTRMLYHRYNVLEY